MSKNLIALQNKFLGHAETVYDQLSRIHDQQGHVSDDDISRLATEHNLPPAHVRATNRGTVFMTFHFPESRTNILIGDAADEYTGCPQYKMCAVRLEKAPAAVVAT